MVYRQLAEWYVNRSGTTKALIKSGLLYGGISAAGNVAAILTGNKTLDTLVDMAAPIVAGRYLSNQLDHTDNSELKNDAIKTLVWAYTGMDIINELMSYTGSADALNYLKDVYSYFNMLTNKVTTTAFGQTVSFGMEAGIISGILGGINEFLTHKKNAIARRAQNMHRRHPAVH